jgi:hypothetical protein
MMYHMSQTWHISSDKGGRHEQETTNTVAWVPTPEDLLDPTYLEGMNVKYYKAGGSPS